MEKLSELIENYLNTGEGFELIIVGFLLIALFKIDKIYDFIDKLSKRELNFLRELIKENSVTNRTQEIVQESINARIFRSVTKINAEKKLRQKIIDIHNLANGRLKYNDFKHAFQFLEIQQNGTLEIRQSNPFELLFYYFSYIASAFYFICFFLLLISLLVAPITDTKARIVLIIYSFLILYIGIVILRMSLPLYCARKIKKEMEYIRKNYHEKIPYNQDLKVNKKPKLLSEEEKEIAKKRFESHFGEIESTDPTNINNETIDADLAQEYSSNNQED